MASRSSFRPDIQAMRAVAVALVVAYHLYPNRLPGGYVGVDVFFVISGFLITSHLLRERDRSGKISLSHFYARRIRRLLPAALLVLLVVTAATLVFAPRTLWVETGRQLFSSTFYFENWALAANAVQYTAAGPDSSPLQHFWSLSVEEQFYLVWPVLMVLVALLTRAKAAVKRNLFAVILIIGVASYAFSIWITGYDPALAYFVTPARGWEFALGGMIAFVPVLRRMPRVAVVARWLGLLLIGGSAALLADQNVFPGWIAIIPVGGAALTILAGNVDSEIPLNSILQSKPVQYLGDISYSLYLWHWPLIVILPLALGSPLATRDKVGVAIASVVLAGLTKALVEDRWRSSASGGVARPSSPRPVRRTYLIAVCAMVVVALPAGALIFLPTRDIAVAQEQLEAATHNEGDSFGAAASAHGDFSEDPSQTVVPAPLIATSDNWTKDAPGCQDTLGPFDGLVSCTFGSKDPDAPQVALVGDSHAGHWQPAVARVAAERGWALTTFVRSSCPLTMVYPTSATSSNSACIKWNLAALPVLDSGEFDLVIVSSDAATVYSSANGLDSLKSGARGMAQAWKKIEASGARVVALRDNPDPEAAGLPDISACVAGHGDPRDCAFPRNRGVLPDPQLSAAKQAGATAIDMTRYFCDVSTCPAVIGGVLVYQDRTHLTRTFARTLAPYLNKALPAAAGK